MMSQINKYVKEQRQMLNKADAEKRDLTATEDRQYRFLDAEVNRLMAAEKTANRLTREANQGPVATQGNYRITAEGYTNLDKRGGDMNYEKSNYKFDYRGDDERDHFWRAVLFDERAGYDKRAGEMMISDDSKGGFLAPTITHNEIIREAKENIFMLNHARHFDCKKGERIEIPILSAEMSDPSFKSEIAETKWDEEMQFNARGLAPKRFMLGVKVSKRLAESNPANVVNFITEELRFQFENSIEYEMLRGDGVNSPLGLLTDHTSGVTSARCVNAGNTTAAIKADNLINVNYNLKAAYLRSPSCRWILHRNTLKMVAKLKTGEGQYIWQQALATGRPNTILGIPYEVSEHMPDIDSASSGARIIALGDLRYYAYADAGGLQIQTLHERYASQGLIGILGVFWIDAGVLLEDAFSISTLA